MWLLVKISLILQKQALALYREVLRVARTKPADGRAGIEALARAEFDTYRGVAKKDFARVEHFLRRGRRQLELLKHADGANMMPLPPPKPTEHS